MKLLRRFLLIAGLLLLAYFAGLAARALAQPAPPPFSTVQASLDGNRLLSAAALYQLDRAALDFALKSFGSDSADNAGQRSLPMAIAVSVVGLRGFTRHS